MFYLALKAVRGDFRYWIPLDGAFGLVILAIIRVMVKFVTDFTGIVHFRLPYEVRVVEKFALLLHFSNFLVIFIISRRVVLYDLYFSSSHWSEFDSIFGFSEGDFW